MTKWIPDTRDIAKLQVIAKDIELFVEADKKGDLRLGDVRLSFREYHRPNTTKSREWIDRNYRQYEYVIDISQSRAFGVIGKKRFVAYISS